ncbi:MAG TPA: LemA family protein [Ferruginibacter sp.]|nr:LemA family protein [Ferruginibacter sp.]HMP20403.1 LemA family protein [Ferruginibacter sp.]
MKRSGIIILVVLGIVVLWAISVRNGLATAQTGINGKWGEVETQFQRKMKLYENVIATIKASAKFEDTVLTKIIAMRSRIPQIDPNNPQSLADANRQLDQMKGSILNINVEAYPTLQTTGAFRDFQAQIEGTENRVSVAIRDWNQAITDYNTKLVKFPANLIAGLFGYTAKANYKADEGARDFKVEF